MHVLVHMTFWKRGSPTMNSKQQVGQLRQSSASCTFFHSHCLLCYRNIMRADSMMIDCAVFMYKSLDPAINHASPSASAVSNRPGLEFKYSFLIFVRNCEDSSNAFAYLSIAHSIRV
jgi:hypothetical protein